MSHLASKPKIVRGVILIVITNLLKGSTMPLTIDEYIATVPEEYRESLETLRKTIQKAAPDAVELISYQVPTFKIYNRPLVAFSASKNYCTFHIMNPTLAKEMADDLTPHGLTAGNLNFRPSKPLPEAVVTSVVKARVDQITKML
jgi:uncharacterized protein YdhG (YjbR/CyaY superfamily)